MFVGGVLLGRVSRAAGAHITERQGTGRTARGGGIRPLGGSIVKELVAPVTVTLGVALLTVWVDKALEVLVA